MWQSHRFTSWCLVPILLLALVTTTFSIQNINAENSVGYAEISVGFAENSIGFAENSMGTTTSPSFIKIKIRIKIFFINITFFEFLIHIFLNSLIFANSLLDDLVSLTSNLQRFFSHHNNKINFVMMGHWSYLYLYRS